MELICGNYNVIDVSELTIRLGLHGRKQSIDNEAHSRRLQKDHVDTKV